MMKRFLLVAACAMVMLLVGIAGKCNKVKKGSSCAFNPCNEVMCNKMERCQPIWKICTYKCVPFCSSRRMACPLTLFPVCGTDGKTYSNQCDLDVTSCQTKGKIVRKHGGKCKTPAKPVCRDDCPFVSDPVCGTDGKTYSNNCVLEIINCKTRGKVVLKHKGECKEDKPVCRDDCPFVSDPVCGTDGKTYSNNCVLEIINCKTRGKVVLKHKGECKELCLVDPCKTNVCNEDEKCVADIENCTYNCRFKCPCDYTGGCSCD